MTTVYVIVAALVFLLLGIFICTAGFFCWYMLKMIRDLKQAVELQVKATHELLGEGSFTRISKSLSVLSGFMPDMITGVNEFAKAVRMMFRAAEEADEAGTTGVRQPAGPHPPADRESAFYPGVSDREAATNEVQAEAARQKLVLSPEDLSRMVTDNL